MVKNKKLKRMIYGGVGFVMAGVMFFAASMQNMQEVSADVRVFDEISKEFPKNAKDFKLPILEIVPNASLEKVSEMGYFLPSDEYLYKNKNQNEKLPPSDRKLSNPTITSQGTVHGARTNTRDEQEYPRVLLEMRNYGLIKPLGIDTTGEYPFYILKDSGNGSGIQAFTNYQTDTNAKYYAETLSMDKGVYSLGKGDYNITEGYTIDENGTICYMEKVSVSDNAVDENGNSISENDATYDPDSKTITVLTPVEVDTSKVALPQSKDGSIQYITPTEKGTGNVKFTPSEKVTNKTQYYGFSDKVLYYMTADNGFYFNASYFREYVLGSAADYEYLDIEYNVKSASEVTAADIQGAKLIYISGQAEAFAKIPEGGEKQDISAEVLLEIYNQEVLGHKAVMMDYACYSADVDTNVSKLATLLWRDSQSGIRTTYSDSYAKDSDILASVDFMTGDALKELQSTMMSGANGNFVTGNVYVYNHLLSNFDDPKSMIDAKDNFANGDFNTAYTAGVMQQGFSSVLSYITATNKNSTTGQMSPAVTPAIAIQYILISDGTPLSIVKTSLNVLEIQPVPAFLYNDARGSEEYGYLKDNGVAKKNREYFVQNYLGNYYDDKVEYVNFTSMTIDEFNGRNEDLIESYDIIYIGSEMGNFYYMKSIQTRPKMENGQYNPSKNVKYNWVDLPSYNDTNMNGMVYYNIGDTMTVENDSIEAWLDTGTDQNRYAGRDLTRNKLQKLIDYLDAEGLVFVEGDLVAQLGGVPRVNPTAHDEWRAATLDSGRIDDSSNLYEFMKYAIGERFNKKTGDYEAGTLEKSYKIYNNLVSICDLEAGLVDMSTIDQYVATEKLELTMTEQPREYSYSLQENSQVMDPSTVQYMEEEANGTRKMKFGFIISSDMVGVTETSTYTPHLYVDVNNDGKYSGVSEDIKDIQIVKKATGEEAERDGSNNYILYKDVEYELSRELDESYSGYIKWKISIQSNIFENSHASVEGSTVVKNKEDDRIVKILQITKDNSGEAGLQTNLNLQTQLADPTSKFGKYLAAVPGYDVAIKTVSVEQFEADFIASWNAYRTAGPADQEGEEEGENTTPPPKKSVQEYALDYFNGIEITAATESTAAITGANMLVLGFGDDYPGFTYSETIQAIQSYMENEKPVLLAHDFIMFRATANQAKQLRNTVGMDKYGMTQNITTETLTDRVVTKLLNYEIHKNEGEKYLHTGVSYTRSDDPDEVALIESTGKAVAYQPGKQRETILFNTQGVSNSTLNRFKKSGNKWLNSNIVGNVGDSGAASYVVNKLNDGQITSYPYELPESFTVARTHGQYFQLDFDEDSDADGESDVVVWYTLGESDSASYNPWSEKSGGTNPSDGFYIYNKGNITYTGAGHANMETGSSEVEAQLFINTLFAAYNATKTEPTVGFYEEAPDADDLPINSIAVPYDENVKKDSSVLKDAQGVYRYKFVNPNAGDKVEDGTPIFFRLNDTNFVRGTKYLEIEYYLKADGKAGESYKLDDGTSKTIETLQEDSDVTVVNISDKITTYDVSNKQFKDVVVRSETTGKLSFMQSGVVYGFYLPMSYLNTNSQYTIYIKAKTRIHTKSSQTGQETVTEVPGEGISDFTVTKADLLDLD